MKAVLYCLCPHKKVYLSGRETYEEPEIFNVKEELVDLGLDTTKVVKSFYTEWRQFVLKKSVFDVAAGLIIASAVTSLTNSLVNDILLPLLVAIWKGASLQNYFIVIAQGHSKNVTYSTLAAATSDGAVTWNYGKFCDTLITFIFYSFAIFILFRVIKHLKLVSEKKLIRLAAEKKLLDDERLKEFEKQRAKISDTVI
eukprot:c1411_g1_i1.p1 GENE.c1411_g1_i1~~c1411_g1_i1.p1  ORF type:complete len:198 (+),score=63.90 c1411_g1_i1:33-626(+)